MLDLVQVSFDIATALSIFLTGFVSGIFLLRRAKENERQELIRLNIASKMKFLDNTKRLCDEMNEEILHKTNEIQFLFENKHPDINDKMHDFLKTVDVMRFRMRRIQGDAVIYADRLNYKKINNAVIMFIAAYQKFAETYNKKGIDFAAINSMKFLMSVITIEVLDAANNIYFTNKSKEDFKTYYNLEIEKLRNQNKEFGISTIEF